MMAAKIIRLIDVFQIKSDFREDTRRGRSRSFGVNKTFPAEIDEAGFLQDAVGAWYDSVFYVGQRGNLHTFQRPITYSITNPL